MFGRSRGGREFGRSRGGRDMHDDIKPIIVENPPIEDFRKNFYEPVSEMSHEEAEKLRQEWDMRVRGDKVPLPVNSFEMLGLKKCLLDFFAFNKFTNPTPIQAQGWPIALSGLDMVGIADTGSGKTLSFLIPALIHIVDQPEVRRGDGPIGLVLAPTRELVMQTEQVCIDLNKFFGIRSLSVYGGASIAAQKRKMLEGIDIVIATPGRLIDLHTQGFCNLERVTFLVLDEADRMLDMGFEDQLKKIIPKTNSKRQTLMWSATWPKEVRQLAFNYTSRDHAQVNIGSDELKVNSKIEQFVEVVSAHDKTKRLKEILDDVMKEKDCKTIIFANKKSSCDRLENIISEKYRAAAIHGDKSQSTRENIIRNLRDGVVPILIATDVAARGLDIRDIKIVINFDLPMSVEDYVHRVGRTCRGSDTTGKSLSFFSPDEDSGNARKYLEIFKQGNVDIPNEIHSIADRSSASSFSRYNRRDGGRRRGNDFGRRDYGNSYGDRSSYYKRDSRY